jgi:hypothetical protein
MFAADAVSQWRSNQITPVIIHLVRSSIVDKACFSTPFIPSMAQASVRGACGFILAGYSDITHSQAKENQGKGWRHTRGSRNTILNSTLISIFNEKVFPESQWAPSM